MAKNIFILAILIVLFFFMFSNPKYIDNKVITKIDTLIQIKEYTQYKKGRDITYKVLDSIYIIDTSQVHDTAYIVKDYNEVKAYTDTLRIDTNAYVYVNDTISQNRILGRGYGGHFVQKTITIKNDIYHKPKNELFLGLIGEYIGKILKNVNNNKPYYIICNTFSNNINTSIPFKLIKKYLNLGYKPDEIFIIAPSIKSDQSPVRSLENLIKKKLNNIPIYVPVSDEEKLDKDILNNKMVFSTFHQVKGLERKIVIVYNFDNSYFKYYKKDKNPLITPNELYVATTRALEHLIILHDYKNDYLPCINVNNIKNYCNFIIYNKLIIIKDKQYNLIIEPSKLTQHLPIDIINKCLDYFDIKIINKPSFKIDIPLKIKDINGYENVSEINGTAIPAYFELITTNKMKIYNELINNKILDDNSDLSYNSDEIDFIDDNDDSTDNPIMKPYINIYNIDLKNIKINELLYITNKYCSYKNGFLFKTYQITNYDWLSKDKLNLAIDKMKEILNISNNAIYEKYFEYTKFKNIIIKGIIDCIDNNNIYEFKCTNKLENNHILQLAIYIFMYESNNNKINNNYYLYNILTGEKNQIIYNYDKLKQMIEYLINIKYNSNNDINDNDFFFNMNNIIKKYV